MVVAKRVLCHVRESAEPTGDKEIRFTTIMDLVHLHAEDTNTAQLMSGADAALYRTKEIGRGRSEVG